MSAISHVQCPACGGAVGFTSVERIVSCPWCRARLLVESDAFVPEFCVPAVLDGIAARRRLQDFLRNRALPEGLLRHARFEDATLCLIPYHEIRARRLGTIEMTVESVRTVSRTTIPDENALSSMEWEEEKIRTARRETRVVTGDVHLIEPAVVMEDAGLREAGIFTLLKGDRPDLPVFNRNGRDVKGLIFAPTVDFNKAIANLNLKGFAATVVDDTQYVETRIRRIFYPFWRLRYRYAGRSFDATVDGVTGEVLFARAPEGDRRRVQWLVAGVMFFGLFMGRMMKDADLFGHLRAASGHVIDPTITVSSALFLLGLFLASTALVAVAVWNQFRYPGDVVKAEGSLQVEKTGSLFGGRTRAPLFSWKEFFQKMKEEGRP